jgi:transposase
MKAYSLDLRKRILAACDRGEGTKYVAERFGVSPSWVRRLKQRRRENGEIGPRSPGGDRRGKFDRKALARLQKRVEAHPGATLEQLRVWIHGELGIQCSVMAVCRALKRIGMTFKKKVSRRPNGRGRTSSLRVSGSRET